MPLDSIFPKMLMGFYFYSAKEYSSKGKKILVIDVEDRTLFGKPIPLLAAPHGCPVHQQRCILVCKFIKVHLVVLLFPSFWVVGSLFASLVHNLYTLGLVPVLLIYMLLAYQKNKCLLSTKAR